MFFNTLLLFTYSTIFLQYENPQKVKYKKKLKYKYNTILAVRPLQKTGVSFHQVPLASDTWN